MPHRNHATTEKSAAADRWIQIVRAEFCDAPGLQLTRGQIGRLWGLNDQICTTVLDALTRTHFLQLKPDGRYKRADDGLSIQRGPRSR